MPGVGVRTGARILVEVGDGSTFPTVDRLAASPPTQVSPRRPSDLDAAASHARTAEQLALTTEPSLVSVLTGWFRAQATAARSTEPGRPAAATAAAHYRAAEDALQTAGSMPGLHRGMFPLALLGLRILHDRPAPTDRHLDWGPYRPWARPSCCLPRTVTRRPVPRSPQRPNHRVTTCRRCCGV